MNIIEVTTKEYKLLKKPAFFFDSVQFNEFNAHKCDVLKYLMFKDSKYRLGIIIGISNGDAKIPFSAPFSGFTHIKDEVSVKQIT